MRRRQAVDFAVVELLRAIDGPDPVVQFRPVYREQVRLCCDTYVYDHEHHCQNVRMGLEYHLYRNWFPYDDPGC